MKKYLLVTSLVLALSAPPLYAITTPPLFAIGSSDSKQTLLEQTANTAKQTVATNINQVLVQILSGVKDAGGEVYGASKVAVADAYDFVKKETPEVIKEFLVWQIVRAIVFVGVWTAFAGLLLFLAHKLHVWAPKGKCNDDREFATLGKWVLGIIAAIILIINLGVNGMTIGKVVYAPRVYIIEYVVDVLHGHSYHR